MSEFEQTQELRKRFLRFAYDLGMTRRARIVSLEEIAGEMQNYIDTSDPAFADRLDEIAVYLGERRLIRSQANGYELLSITSEGIDEVEGRDQGQQPSVSNIFNISGDTYGSVIGTHNTTELTNNFDFRFIEEQIEREGGEDKEELKRALAQVQRLLERGEYLDRGALAQFSGAMERHSWFTGSVMQALLGFATQAVS